MITATVLALALLTLAPTPAHAVTKAECEAYLCLPGGFPPSECSPAKAAVLRRLAALQPALPPWASCAAAFNWDTANLSHTERRHEECPNGGTLTNGECRGKDANDCDFSYAPQKKVTVQVSVDGSTAFQPNRTLTHTVSAPGAKIVTCPPPPPPPTITQEGGRCPPGWHFYRYLTADGVTWAEVCLEHPVAPTN